MASSYIHNQKAKTESIARWSRIVIPAQLHYIKQMIISVTLRLGSICIAMVSLAGCITTPEMKNRWSFVCSDDYKFDVVYARNKKSLKFVDTNQSLKLKLQQSDEQPDSAVEPIMRYADDVLMFEPAGVMAQVFVDGEIEHVQCQGSAY